MENENNEGAFREHAARIERHYKHARQKHPYFCDRITCLSETGADTHLGIYRATLAVAELAGNIEAVDVVQCELYEAVQAYTKGDIPNAIEECYDAIAVLLRIVEVLEGRQMLGRPKRGEEAK